MVKLFEYPDREFRLWMYVPTHSKLLLRSGRETSGTTRIDIAFGDVDWLNIPIIMKGLTIERLGTSRARRVLASESMQGLDPERIMAIYGSNYEGYISAGLVESDESDLWFRDPDRWGIFP